MKLYLIRHSNAIDPGTPDYEDDSQRPLTEKGRDKMYKIASALKELGVKPDLIVSSPYIRARQTADILAKVLKYKPELTISETLIPMGNADDIVGEINEKYSVDELVLIGHEPSLSGLIGTLVAGNPEIDVNLKNGGVCCLSADDLHTDRKAVLEWLLPPKILTALS
ncbi:MAG: phosphohistidine phosphatase SixA [Anaerolineales bacterium]